MCLITQSCLILCHPVDYNLPGTSVHGILQARILEWVAIPFSRRIFLTQGSSPGLRRGRQTLYDLRHQGSPRSWSWSQPTWAQSKTKAPTNPDPIFTPNQLHKKQNICPDKNPTFLQINLLYIWTSSTSQTTISITGCKERTIKIPRPVLIKRKMSSGLTESQSSEVFRSLGMQGYGSNVKIPPWEAGRNRISSWKWYCSALLFLLFLLCSWTCMFIKDKRVIITNEIAKEILHTRKIKIKKNLCA